jgi:hypothetical protein
MSNLIVDWDSNFISNQGTQIIDIYTTNLIEIPLDEYELAEYAYYEALSNYITDNSPLTGNYRSR